VAAVAILGGGVVMLSRGSNGSSGGAASPKAAAQQVIDGVMTTDLVRSLRALDPDEAKALAPVGQDLLRRAKTSGLAKAGDNPFKGVKLKLEGHVLSEESLAPDVTKVTLDGGRLTATVDKSQLSDPLKAAARPAEGPGATRDLDLGRLDIRDAQDRRIALFVVTVKRDGRWWVSPLLTGVQYLTLAGSDLRQPDYSPLPTNSSFKAGSPTEAVQRLAQAGSDPAAVADALPAAEGRAVRALGGVLSNQLRRLRDLRVDASALVDEKGPDGRRLVRVGRANLDVSVSDNGGDQGNGPVRVQGELDRDCVSDRSKPDAKPACTPDVARKLGFDGLRLVTVKERGQWRVSLVETVALYLRTALDKASDPQLSFAASLVGGPAVLAAFPPAATVPAAGATADVKLNDGGWAVVGIDAAPGQVFGYDVRESNSDDTVNEVALYGPDGKVWDRSPSSVVIAAQAGRHRLVLKGTPGASAKLSTHPARRETATVGKGVTGTGAAPVIVEVTGAAGAKVRADTKGVSASTGEPAASGWVNEGDAAPYSPSTGDVFPATGKMVVTLTPYGDGPWSYEVKRRANEFSDGTMTVSGTFGGSTATHAFTVVNGGATVTLTPSGWDAVLSISCIGAGSATSDHGFASAPESLTIRSTGDDTCTASVTSFSGTGTYSLSIR